MDRNHKKTGIKDNEEDDKYTKDNPVTSKEEYKKEDRHSKWHEEQERIMDKIRLDRNSKKDIKDNEDEDTKDNQDTSEEDEKEDRHSKWHDRKHKHRRKHHH